MDKVSKKIAIVMALVAFIGVTVASVTLNRKPEVHAAGTKDIDIYVIKRLPIGNKDTDGVLTSMYELFDWPIDVTLFSNNTGYNAHCFIDHSNTDVLDVINGIDNNSGVIVFGDDGHGGTPYVTVTFDQTLNFYYGSVAAYKYTFHDVPEGMDYIARASDEYNLQYPYYYVHTDLLSLNREYVFGSYDLYAEGGAILIVRNEITMLMHEPAYLQFPKYDFSRHNKYYINKCKYDDFRVLLKDADFEMYINDNRNTTYDFSELWTGRYVAEVIEGITVEFGLEENTEFYGETTITGFPVIKIYENANNPYKTSNNVITIYPYYKHGIDYGGAPNSLLSDSAFCDLMASAPFYVWFEDPIGPDNAGYNLWEALFDMTVASDDHDNIHSDRCKISINDVCDMYHWTFPGIYTANDMFENWADNVYKYLKKQYLLGADWFGHDNENFVIKETVVPYGYKAPTSDIDLQGSDWTKLPSVYNSSTNLTTLERDTSHVEYEINIMNDPWDEFDVSDSTTVTMDVVVKINKTDSVDGSALSGAFFDVYDATDTKLTTTPIETNAQGIATFTIPLSKTITSATFTVAAESEEAAKLAVKDQIDADLATKKAAVLAEWATYKQGLYLKETKAPNGYVKNDRNITQ